MNRNPGTTNAQRGHGARSLRTPGRHLRVVPDPKRTIVIAEDDRSVAELLGMILRLNGFRVLQASDGAEAVYMAGTALPDLILMDLGLPKVDGLTACHLVRTCEQLDGTPVIVLTGDTSGQTRSACLLAGASDCVTKPFDVEDLIGRINAAIAGAQPRRRPGQAPARQ